MFSTLNNEVIAQFDAKYLDMINSMPIAEFWDHLEDISVDYQDVLYLIMKFCKGEISGTPWSGGSIIDDHVESCDTLAQLNYEGVLTHDGQRSFEHTAELRQRSYLDFEISFNTQELDMMIQLMETLHKRGLNVFASIQNLQTYKIHYVNLFKAPQDCEYRDCDVYELNGSSPISDDFIQHDLHWVKNTLTSMHPNCSPYEFVENMRNPHDYTITASVFNIEWNQLQADEIVLQSMIELKNKN